MNLNKFNFPVREIIKTLFVTGKVVDLQLHVLFEIESTKQGFNKFFKNLENVTFDFDKVKDGAGHFMFSAYNEYRPGPVSIKFIYDDYRLQKVEYKDLNSSIIYKELTSSGQ